MTWRYEDKGTAGAVFADPTQALHDVREAHAWASAELAVAEPMSTHAWVITEERKRLAVIFQEIKRQI